MLNLLISLLTHNKQRCLLWVKGDLDWAENKVNSWLSQISAETKVTWFGDVKTNALTAKTQNKITDVRIKQYKKMLGQETNVLVYDAYAGLNPDALGALVGTITQGGVCIVISPNIPQWLEYVDPEYNRLCVEPYKPEQISNYYIQYIISQLTQSRQVLTLTQEQDLTDEHVLQQYSSMLLSSASLTAQNQNSKKQNVSANLQYNFCKTKDQLFAVKKLFEQVMVSHLLSDVLTDRQLHNGSYAAVLESDRGRGKSSALGIFAGLILVELFEQKKASKQFNIVLTAPHSSSVKGVFDFCETVLSQNKIAYSTDKNTLKTQHGVLFFVAPDELINNINLADIILVDEAAAIPSQMLMPVFSDSSKVNSFFVFATTIHGYEGTGRGFEYKLKPLLKNTFNTVESLLLTQPIRWSDNDFLEADINKMLMIGAVFPDLSEQDLASINSDNVQFKTLSSKQLIAQPDKLSNLFGLLVNAHYRTTPNDLRNMLDGPNMRIFCLEYQGIIIGALLLAEEGKLSPELAEQIWQGRRRPKGHLLPQSLLTHSGFKQAGDFKYGRVVRIAIHPELQNQGLGSLLLNKVKQNITKQGLDFICTSFGAADNLVQFWLNNQFSPVRLGLKAEASSGEYSVLMTQALNVNSERFEAAVTARFQQTLLVEQLFNMRASLGLDLLKLEESEHKLKPYTEQDQSDLLCFSHHYKALDTCLLAMFRFIKAHEDIEVPSIITDKIVSKLSNKALIKKYNLTGEKQLVETFRHVWKALVS